jgi:hypothetical protein
MPTKAKAKKSRDEIAITKAIEAVKADGWRITEKWWVDRWNGGQRCCALGAVAVTVEPEVWGSSRAEELATKKLRKSESWVASFVNGFDGNSATLTKTNVTCEGRLRFLPAAYKLGLKLRKKYLGEGVVNV